ncbi:putative transcription factor interactor and regulator CCHC(Zn) family [Helianthus annuus]|nr:putative transcription factor interactor and regulator CCHC(Zn) family [Helianthus annuus]
MAKVYPRNPSSQLPDHRSTSDHLNEHPHNHDSVKKPTYAASFNRGGGGARAAGGRGGRGCCFRCGEPGHFIRECPVPAPSSRTNNTWREYLPSLHEPVKVDVIEFTDGSDKVKPKAVNSSNDALTNLEPVKFFSNKLPPKSVDESLLLAKIKEKEKELQLRDQEIDSLNTRLNKATAEWNLCRTKNEEMNLNMKKFQEDLEKSREEISNLREKDDEMYRRWCALNNELEEAKGELNEKIEELEDANEANESAVLEITRKTMDVEHWRKAAKAITSVLVAGADICSKTSELEFLVLYYSNRAAKRMSLGKFRKALDDCKVATRLDPSFLKVFLTAGNCHLVLGDIDDALYNYKKCLDSRMVCLDRRLIIEASDGLQKAEKVVSYISKLAELLQHKTFESATTALEVVEEALSISRYSEKLLEMKGEALLMLHKHEEVIQMCEQTLTSAEKNCVAIDDIDHMPNEDQVRPLKLWRWSLMARSNFHMAKFDLALSILEKYEQLAPSETKTQGPSSLSCATISELLRCKDEGNKAFKGGKYREAVEHYSNAIMQSIESKSFTAICLCNRAAARQALGEVTDAIADCNIAIALDGDYMKAISRRAKLHEKIRDYEHAAIDFQRLISLLEKKRERKYEDDITVARRHLSLMNKNMKKGNTLNLYLILGLKGSESGSEIKKAYHKAALRHHPDKAGKFLARSESGLDGHVWKEIFTTIHEEADKLFKKIGEAYAVLSDANKRFNYNLHDTTQDDYGWNFNE